MIKYRTIQRLLLYRLCLSKYQRLGFIKVFSYNLGEQAGFTAAQVRKDFSFFGIRGSKRGGYDIEYLQQAINNIFKQNGERYVILVGMGNIGQALVNYQGFRENKINIVAGFDLDPSKYTRKYAIPVHHPDKIKGIVKRYKVKTAIIAVPEAAGQEICDNLVAAGIIAILNFSHIILRVPDHVMVNNVNLQNELESLFYYT